MRKLVVVTSILMLCACGQEPESLEPGTRQDGLVNGFEDSGHLEVVSINADGNRNCTGTLLGYHTALTAAHCVDNGGRVTVQGMLRRYDYDERIWVIEPFVVYATAHRHPAFDGDLEDGADVAVIVFDWPVWGVARAALSSSTPVNSQVTLVGFGDTGFGHNNFGTLRYGFNTIDSVTPTFFYHSGATGGDATLCHGDSGGPAFLGGYSSTCLAGVAHATVFPACSPTGGIHTRVDTVAAWIRSIAPETIPGC